MIVDAALDALRSWLHPDRVVTDPAGVDAAAVWNGAVVHRPAVVVTCASTQDVQHAVRAAREADLPLSVRGGGHDWAGRALRAGGLVVDLSGMRSVSVDGLVATVAGGATTVDVAEAADRHGLAAVTGTVGDVGMLGLTLGGGYGPLSARFGLAADNLGSAEVVLADGRVARTDDDPELLWALRGGGGNFGVVTSAEITLHPLPEVLVGAATFPGEQVAPVLTGLRALLAEAPDELGVVTTLVTRLDGRSALTVASTWAGPAADGRLLLDAIADLGAPLVTEMNTVSPLAKLRQLDGLFPAGMSVAIRTRNVEAFTPDVVAALIDAYEARSVPGTIINIHHAHGAATRAPLDSASFGLRQDHHMIEFIEMRAPEDAPVSDWAQRASGMLAPHALPGGYPNLLGPDDGEQAAQAYGPHASRLLEVKRRLDPDGVFAATPLPARTLA